jgi:single-strand DNA-binding protein
LRSATPRASRERQSPNWRSARFNAPSAVFLLRNRCVIVLTSKGEFMSVNKVILVGRLGRDPETRYTGGGQAVANFSVATDETYKDRNGERQKRTEWHKIVVWGKQAEIAQQYLKKGSLIFIEGRIQSREWQDKEGQKRTSFEIVASNFRMLGGRADGAAAGASAGAMGGGASRAGGGGGDDFDAGVHDEPAAPGAGPEISDEDIPF